MGYYKGGYRGKSGFYKMMKWRKGKGEPFIKEKLQISLFDASQHLSYSKEDTNAITRAREKEKVATKEVTTRSNQWEYGGDNVSCYWVLIRLFRSFIYSMSANSI